MASTSITLGGMLDPFVGMTELQRGHVLGSEWKGRANQHSTTAVQPPISAEDVTTVHINQLELEDSHGRVPDVFSRLPSDHMLYGHLASADDGLSSNQDFDRALDLILSESLSGLG